MGPTPKIPTMTAVPTPKDRFTSLDTLAVVRELRRLERSRLDKVFDFPAGGWVVAFRVPREGRREVVLVPGRFSVVASHPVSHAEEISPFARELRRLLEGAVFEGAADPAGERLLELSFRRSDEPGPLRVALEMFGAGNLVVARADKIAAAAQSRKWAHRTVGVGAQYARPPTRTNPFAVGIAEIEAELARSRTDLISTLGARFALGGPLAEEVLARGGWDGAGSSAADAAQVAPRLHRVLHELLAEVGERPNGYLYLKDGVAVDATPYRSRRWAGIPGVEELTKPSFSDAAWEYFSTLVQAPISDEARERINARQELEHQLDRQRAAVVELEARVDQLKLDAQAVLDHYPKAEQALAGVTGPDAGPTVEAKLGDRSVALQVGESPRATAQALFEEAKRQRTKAVGAKAAVADAERKLAEFSALPDRPSVSASARRAEVARRRTRWFERYRWFLSSEGGIVIGGRDASSNDQVVRRNLKDGDFYVHADLHGAASVVVKHAAPGEPPITEVTLAEAAQWAVAFSKAWRAGLASAEAFWVESDQVSKTPASGEFVARGAWVIHGTKHVLKDLPLELALGTIDYRGETFWTAAPPTALRSRGTIRVLLAPGPERERPELEVALVRDLGVDRTLLQSLLPAGGISVRRA